MKKDSKSILTFGWKFMIGLILLLITFILSLVLGAADTTIQDVWHAFQSQTISDKATMIQEIRLPREIAAIFVGAALSVAGAIMQGMTRNPLADPSLLGLTSGAAAALSITIAFLPNANYFSIMIACFIGAAVGALLVFGLSAMKKGGISPLRIVLAGAAVSAFLIAISEGVGLYFKLSKSISMWTAGGLIGTTWEQLKIIVPVILIGLILAFCFSRQLTILSLSEEVAVGLGQKTAYVKIILFIIVVLLAGASVALIGNMAFIGLMIPHIIRAVVGTDYRFILPMAAIGGAIFMLLADTVGRTLNAPYETPIIAVVSVLGLPFFLFIVNKGGRAFL